MFSIQTSSQNVIHVLTLTHYFLDDIGGNKNDGTSLTKDSNKQKPESASAGVASEDQLHSSGEENSTNEESEED